MEHFQPPKGKSGVAKLALEKNLALALYKGFQQSNDVMFLCDRDGTILDANAAFTRVYGFARAEAVGSTPRILRSRHSTAEVYRRMWADILDPAKGYWRGQIINRAKDGREIPVVLTITSVRDEGGSVIGYVSNAMDVTEQVAMQGRMAHAEALAGLGEMAAVVAHEIRNPLGSVVMAAKQLASASLAEEDRAMVLRVLREESQRLNETLTNFLAYARPRGLSLTRGDLNAVAAETCRILESNRELLRDVSVRVALDPGLEPLLLDAGQVRQVAWNILLNAVQAMDGEGTLSVRTGREEGWSFLRIQDTGPGVPEPSRSEIFKPFHTTKRQGTGLGLAIADRIVKAHGGRIELECPPGGGAAFTVYLPSVRG